MRRTRRLFLVVLVALVAAVATSYYRQRARAAASEPPIPASLSANTRALSTDWVYYRGTRDCRELEIRAKEAEGVEQPKAKFLLRGVDMKIFHDCGRSFDLIKSGTAEFDEQEGKLFADGEVDITLAVPEEGKPSGRLVNIKSSGVLLDARNYKAHTDRYSRFSFDLGEGEAVGADYDPHSRELTLNSNIKLHWRGREGATPMVIEAGHLVHKEKESKVFLSPWSKLARETLTMESGDTVVTLDGGNITLVEAVKAKGIDAKRGRALDFGGNELRMEFGEHSQVEKIAGSGDAWLRASSPVSNTDIRTPRIDLAFVVRDKESFLTSALATGKTVLESRPVVVSNKITPHNRILRADGVLAKMRENGEEVESVETSTPGEIDLIPNHPTQSQRWMSGERIWMKYAANNQLESFRAVQVATRTLKPKAKEPALTWSRELTAQFEPETGEMKRMEQWDNFRYKEAAREATAARAVLEPATDLITLDKAARAWDPTGSVSAAHIVMNQKTGDYTAEGDVSSTRLPDARPATQSRKGGAMLEQDQPMQAKAARMTSTEGNKKILYEGNAVLWQASNRLQADRVFIDRKEQKLVANGKVVSQFLDKRPKGGTTVVRSKDLVYTDADRVAHYTGGARMDRDGMNVRAAEIRAWLNENDKEKKDESSLNHAFADGAVQIFHVQPSRNRRGSSEHAEYYASDERVVLNGGNPQLDDSVDGITRGKQLTYRVGNDSLQVEGAQTQPVVSKIRRK